MRAILIMWAAPLTLFWAWFLLSANDVNFGYVMLSRPAHDLAMEIYATALGCDPSEVPWTVAKACALDSLIVLALFAYRRRRKRLLFSDSSRRFQRRLSAIAGGTPVPSA